MLAMLAILIATMAPSVLAAAPDRSVIDLGDPAVAADESEFVSGLCGFAIDVTSNGQIRVLRFPGGSQSVLELNIYNMRFTYTNALTGASIRLRDIGPDRFFIKDGLAYVAVTGRATTSTGIIGVVTFDLATGDIVHSAGNDVGWFYGQLCAAIGP